MHGDAASAGMDALGELGPKTRAQELDELQDLDPAVRRDVLVRYAALHSYSELAKPTSRDAERLGATIGTKRTNFLRLLARVREHGAVEGLVRHRRVRPRASSVRDGLPENAERALASALREDPISTLMDVRRSMQAELRGSDVPSMSTLRRRIYAARQAGAGGEAADALVRPDAVFGRRIALGGTLTDLVADRGAEYAPYELQSCFIGLLIDVETRLVIGAGLSPMAEAALKGAVADVGFFLDAMPVGSAGISVEEPTVLSIGRLHEAGSEVGGEDLDPGGVDDGEELLAWTVPDVLSGRSSRLLYRLVGDRLGAISLRPSSKRRVASSKVSTIDGHRLRVRSEVDRWNYLILCARQGVRPEVGEEVVARRLRQWSKGPVAAFGEHSLRFEGLGAYGSAGTAAAVHRRDREHDD